MLKRVGINGFGRIGRNFLRAGFGKVDICAINDLPFPITSLSHLLKYDSLMGIYKKDVSVVNDCLLVAGKKIKVFSDWRKLLDLNNIDIVLINSDFYTGFEIKRNELHHLLVSDYKIYSS